MYSSNLSETLLKVVIYRFQTLKSRIISCGDMNLVLHSPLFKIICHNLLYKQDEQQQQQQQKNDQQVDFIQHNNNNNNNQLIIISDLWCKIISKVPHVLNFILNKNWDFVCHAKCDSWRERSSFCKITQIFKRKCKS
jgi:hypothetical protein